MNFFTKVSLHFFNLNPKTISYTHIDLAHEKEFPVTVCIPFRLSANLDSNFFKNPIENCAKTCLVQVS
jgi:hypothetical protein